MVLRRLASLSGVSVLVLSSGIPIALARDAGRAVSSVCAGQAFVTNSGAASLSIIDTQDDAVLATLRVGEGPVNPVLSPDGSQLFVVNSGARTISMIDVASRTITATLPVGEGKPTGLAVTPDGKRLVLTYFGAQPKGDPNKPQIQGVRTLPLENGRVLTLFGNEVEVPGAIRTMDIRTGRLTKPIAVGGGPERIALTPDGNQAYVANLHSGTVSVVDLRRKAVIATIPTGYPQPFNVKIDRSGSRVFVNHVSGERLVVIDVRTNQIVKSLAVEGGPNGIALNPDESRIYFTNFKSGSVQYADTASWQLSVPVPVKNMPGFMTLTPDGKKGLFVMPAGASVEVLDIATMKVSASIATERGPSVVTICGSP